MTNEAAMALIKHLIGTRYYPAHKGFIRELVDRTDVLGPEDLAITPSADPYSPEFSYEHERIIIDTDEHGIITDFLFG
ncbi:MAG TPA: hypothetical protein VF682_23840 [Pseudomonas sp.]|jgi:hypothetical protein